MVSSLLIYLLYPFTFIYRFLFWWDKKRTVPQNLENTVVWSIGNLSLGGTGKTPFVIYLLDLALKHTGLELVVLSRGYGASKSGEGMEVQVTSKPDVCGDEPLLIKKTHPEARVIIGKNRYESFLKFTKPSDRPRFVFLEDGFQHHKLKRDIDFVLIDAEHGIGNGMVFPSGRMRESEDALERAQYVVFTKVRDTNRYHVNSLRDRWEKRFPNLKFLHFTYTPIGFYNHQGHSLSLDEMKFRDVYLFSGIGNPDSFRDMVKPYCRTILGEKIFRDHYQYTETDLANLYSNLKSGTVLLCTEKDFVKLTHLGNISKYSGVYYVAMKGHLEEEASIIENFKSLTPA